MMMRAGFSTLQRVEIAEIIRACAPTPPPSRFQYSSTSRNCRNPVGERQKRSPAVFQYSSTSRNCRNLERRINDERRKRFQYSSTSRNCRNLVEAALVKRQTVVSVLFNESKLPKSLAHKFPSVKGFVSVLFNESKLPKSRQSLLVRRSSTSVSVLFNESKLPKSNERVYLFPLSSTFQYSSTSRNCRNDRGRCSACL